MKKYDFVSRDATDSVVRSDVSTIETENTKVGPKKIHKDLDFHSKQE